VNISQNAQGQLYFLHCYRLAGWLPYLATCEYHPK